MLLDSAGAWASHMASHTVPRAVNHSIMTTGSSGVGSYGEPGNPQLVKLMDALAVSTACAGWVYIWDAI